MNCSVKFLILFSHFWANSLLAIQLSDHIVFSFHGSNRQARQLAQQYEWIYISEVYRFQANYSFQQWWLTPILHFT